MEIEVRSSGVDLMEALRAYLQRRMRFRFDRHPDSIRKITVRLEEQKTARSEGKQLCRISAELIPSGKIFVSESSRDLYQAIGGGIERLGSALHRVRTKERTTDRGYESVRQRPRMKALGRRGGRRNARARRQLFERGRAAKSKRLRS